MDRREFVKAAVTAAAGAAICRPAIAQAAWPAKGRTIKVIVPWPPGAANDALGRLVAQRLQEKYGVAAIVENRTGGSGLIGTKYVIDADPDGYTFLASAFNTAVMPLVLKSADFNPETDLEVIARTGIAPLVCVMTGDRPQKTVSEVVSAAKADPGNWNFAISATGSAGHLATIDFLQRTGATIPMVAYRGTQPALLDLMAGAVQLLIDTSFALIPAAKDERRRTRSVSPPPSARSSRPTFRPWRKRACLTSSSSRGTDSGRPKARRPRSSRRCTTSSRTPCAIRLW